MKEFISVVADLFAITASGIAIYIFLAKGVELRAFLRTISNFVHQSSLAELRQKLERLSELNATDAQQAQEIVNVFHDVCGQIDGNPLLREQFTDFADRTRKATGGKKQITEHQKRALVSELRECLRHLDVATFAESMGDYRK